MKEIILVDANVLIRFLLRDHPKLSEEAKQIFLRGEKGEVKIYIDEVVIAETVWVLTSFYKIGREQLGQSLLKLISQDWMINSKKRIIIQTLDLFLSCRLDYIDCWLLAVSRINKISLKTFDKMLEKVSKQDLL
ncbi:MAG: PilT protein domain protein [Candidatus Gottesmanbacteria bacterium GW2011_GWC2_39_8]|uniref:PilT protein domain protein n=1 Tax=Candidatus Gottesmanbacteria bacterium GW2011_GWC2_39_8 TaxID=1618450 RepID=A0A0G0PYR9_9BACT|nr:MAG: PilT protein domain protein [Candidatus Gottesmanbacteria bacterium GW2011_GWC2_39_8]